MLPSVDYSKTVIYKITCNDPSVTELYVGSTSDFIRRKTEHKSRCLNYNLISCKFKVYNVIRLHGGWFCWTMSEIESFPCHSKQEAHERERYHFIQLNACLNMKYPIRSDQQYYEAHKEKIKCYQKEYYAKKKLAIQNVVQNNLIPNGVIIE